MTFPTSFPTPGMSAEHIATLYTERNTATSRISQLPHDIVDYVVAPYSQVPEAPVIKRNVFDLGPVSSTDDTMGAFFSIN